MGKKIDLTGKTIGRWTVIAEAGRNKHGAVFWKCRCSCGTEKTVLSSSLIQGVSQSCGLCPNEPRNTYKIEDNFVNWFLHKWQSLYF